MHDMMIAATFVAMLLIPCIVAAFTGTSEENA